MPKSYVLKPLMICLSTIGFSPFVWAENGEQNAVELSEIVVDGNRIHRDEIGYNRVYARDISNLYKGKQEIETYRGNSVSDLFNGMVGVYSGDARNSGALDPNIRGIQGQGRIPVTIDGTEQSITVWRGYAGSNNRNYVDPNLISSIYIEKGPSLNPEVKSGIGGSVAMKTLEIDDIVPEGEQFALEIKTEIGNNAISPLPNKYAQVQDYRTLSGGGIDVLGGMWRMYYGADDRQAQRFGGQNRFDDKAARIAMGVKQEKFDALFVYAYRNKGNYFSGKKGGEKYSQLSNGCIEDVKGGVTHCMRDVVANPFVSYLARLYFPGGEVTNTSLNTESWLGKFNYHFSSEQSIGINARFTETHFGEIMPSRIGISQNTFSTVLQWPEAWVKQRAFNLDYRFNPKDKAWLNLKASLWATFTHSKTNSAGGAPGDVLYLDNTAGSPEEVANSDVEYQNTKDVFAMMYGLDPNLPADEFKCQVNKELKSVVFSVAGGCYDNTDGRFNTIDGAAYYAKNNRIGFNVSNIFKLHPKLDLVVAGNIQHEILKAHNNFGEFFKSPNKTFSDGIDTKQEAPLLDYNKNLDNIAMPRNGKRSEYALSFHFKYRPLDWLTINAGAQYNTYNLTDHAIVDYLNNSDKYKNQQTFTVINGIAKRVETAMTPEEYQAWQNQFDPSCDAACKALINGRRASPGGQNYWLDYVVIEKDQYGRLNTQALAELEQLLRNNKKVIDAANPSQLIDQYRIGHYDLPSSIQVSRQELIQKAKNKKGGGWVPHLSVTAQIGDYGRFYLRYSEHLRWPSIFEGTVGFGTTSAEYSPDLARAYFDFLPEHAKNWEVGYVHQLTGLIPKARHADIRLNYYHNTTKNVMDRDELYVITQYDKRIQSGVELQARLDLGRVFGDIAVVRSLKTQVCDKGQARKKAVDIALRRNILPPNVAECMNGGWNENGYLTYAVQPRWSVTANLGSRWLDNQLELGTRFTYHSRVKDGFYDADLNKNANELSITSWQPVFLVDAYARYRINQYFTLELSGTNLGNRYYQDPLTSTMMPGPGRTIRFALTGKF